MRNLNKQEEVFIGASLQRLREHFNNWSEYGEGQENALIAFALYEGCYKDAASGRVIYETAPFALGQELVKYYSFKWMIVETGFGVVTYAVTHPQIDQPIDLLALESGKWCEEKFEEPPIPGEKTLYSLDPILRAAKLRRRENDR